MESMFKYLTMISQNVTKVFLMLFAISSFCGCEAERVIKIGETAPVFSAMSIAGEPVSLS